MDPAVKASLVVVPAIGGGTPAGAYALTRESIGSQEKIKNNVLPEDLADGEGSSWKTKEDLLKSGSTVPKSPEFKEWKTKINEDSSSNGKLLKELCVSSYSKNYKSIFTSERTFLKDDVEEFCIHKIKDKFGTSHVFNTTDQTDKTALETKTTSLKDHQDSDTNGKIDLESDDFKGLNEIKGKSDVTGKWEKLREWCKGVYERGYRGEGDNLWKIAKTYCKKES